MRNEPAARPFDIPSPAPIRPGSVASLTPLVRRLTAPNPGMMTGPGTNTYILGIDALAVIDPGPISDSHLAALCETVGARLRWIFCTHTHIDHSPGAAALKAATGAQVLGMRAPRYGNQDQGFTPDRVLSDGETVDCGDFELRALHTPGHASNHLCYLLDREKTLFTGDHVMQGSTVVINPPDGDMLAYLSSLALLLQLEIDTIAPGHGYLIAEPRNEVRRLVTHRLGREQKVVDALMLRDSATLADLTPVVYSDTDPRMHTVAARSLHAHLLKLKSDGRAVERDDRWALIQ